MFIMHVLLSSSRLVNRVLTALSLPFLHNGMLLLEASACESSRSSREATPRGQDAVALARKAGFEARYYRSLKNYPYHSLRFPNILML